MCKIQKSLCLTKKKVRRFIPMDDSVSLCSQQGLTWWKMAMSLFQTCHLLFGGVVVFQSLKKSSVCSSFHKQLKQTESWEPDGPGGHGGFWDGHKCLEISCRLGCQSHHLMYVLIQCCFPKKEFYHVPQLVTVPLPHSALSLSQLTLSLSLAARWTGLSSPRSTHGRMHVVARTCLSLHSRHTSLGEHGEHLASLQRREHRASPPQVHPLVSCLLSLKSWAVSPFLQRPLRDAFME